MNIEQIEEMAQTGRPFSLTVADGAEYEIPHPDFISFPPKKAGRRSYVVVHKSNGVAAILSLVTVTTLTYKDDMEAA